MPLFRKAQAVLALGVLSLAAYAAATTCPSAYRCLVDAVSAGCSARDTT